MDELARIALVGTAKHPAASRVDESHPADALLGALTGDNCEHAFLLRAGVQAVFGQSGHTAREAPPIEPSPPETKPVASSEIAGLLQTATSSDAHDLFLDFISQLNEAGLLLPPDMLPAALDATDAAARHSLLPVLGQRGGWLAQFDPKWQWAVAGALPIANDDLDTLRRRWEEGTKSERIDALKTLRRSDPQTAREWLEAAVDKEKAEERLKYINVLESNLSLADETFLEVRLDDRSEQVRQLAARLLATLPGSALAQRMLKRAETLLVTETSGLLRKKTRLVCTPPQEIEKSWERDGLGRKAPANQGKRALWAETILGMTPPGRWSQRFALEPEQLIEAVRDDTFAEAVLAGWTAAAIAFHAIDPASAAWLLPLWNYWLAAALRCEAQQIQTIQERLAALIRALPREAVTDAMLTVLDADLSGPRLQLLDLLSFLPRPWSEKLAARYLNIVRTALKRCDERAVRLAETLAIASRALPGAALDADLAMPEPSTADGANSYQQQIIGRDIAKFLERVRLRQAFDRALQAEAAYEASSEQRPLTR